jgi:hypothetical protein
MTTAAVEEYKVMLSALRYDLLRLSQHQGKKGRIWADGKRREWINSA